MAQPSDSFDFRVPRLNGADPVVDTDYSDQGTPMNSTSLQSYRTREQDRLERQLEHAERGKSEWKKRCETAKASFASERRELSRQIGEANGERDLVSQELKDKLDELERARSTIGELESRVQKLRLEEKRADEFSKDLVRAEADLKHSREAAKREATQRRANDRRIKVLEQELAERDEIRSELLSEKAQLQVDLQRVQRENAQVVMAKTATPTVPERVDSSKPRSPGLGAISLNDELRSRYGSRSPAKNLLTRSPGLAKRGGGAPGTPLMPVAHPRDRFRAMAAGTPAEESRASPATAAAAAADAAADAAALDDALAREAALKRAREHDLKAMEALRAELHALKIAHADLQDSKMPAKTAPPPALEVESRSSSEGATESRALAASENNRKALEKARRLMIEVESLGHTISCASSSGRQLGPSPWDQIDEAHEVSKQDLKDAIRLLKDVCPESVDPATVPQPVKVSVVNSPAASAVLSLVLWGIVMFVVDTSFLQ